MSLKIRQLDRLLLLLNDSNTLDNRRGRPGEILYDWTNNTLRVYSAKPEDADGGVSLLKADLSNIDAAAQLVVDSAALGNLSIEGSTITTQDSSPLVIDQTLTVQGGLQFSVGSLVRGFDTDPTLGSEQNTADDLVPTQGAVRGYVTDYVEDQLEGAVYFDNIATQPPELPLGALWVDPQDGRLYHRQSTEYWVEIGGTGVLNLNSDVTASPNSLVTRDSAGDVYAAGLIARDAVITPSLRSGNTALDAGVIEGTWTLSVGSRLQSTWADLAEWHSSDQPWAPGTVLEINPLGLMTASSQDQTTRVAGVVTTEPAYVMNSQAPEPRVCVALAGCVPVNVVGPVTPGDLLVASELPGRARRCQGPAQPGTLIGKALDAAGPSELTQIRMLVLTS